MISEVKKLIIFFLRHRNTKLCLTNIPNKKKNEEKL